jgi:hypothetical protein
MKVVLNISAQLPLAPNHCKDIISPMLYLTGNNNQVSGLVSIVKTLKYIVKTQMSNYLIIVVIFHSYIQTVISNH